MKALPEYKTFSVTTKGFTTPIQFRLRYIEWERSTIIQIFNPKLKIWQYFDNKPMRLSIDQGIAIAKRKKPIYFRTICVN